MIKEVMYDKYLPVVLAALTVLVLGCINPQPLQTTVHNKPSGYPNYMWLALAALLVGLLSCYVMGTQGRGSGRLGSILTV